MRTKIIVAALALATATSPVMTALASPGQSSTPVPHKAAPGTNLSLTFDNGESLRAGTRVRDTSGHGNYGRVVVQDGGTLHRDAGLVRRGADFPARCATCGRAIIEVPDGPGLDPRRRSFVFGAAVKLTKAQAATKSNVVQKGYFNQAGGQFKIQLSSGGTPSCVVFGARGRVKVTGTRDLVKRRWHRISCARTPAGLILRIEGKVRAREAGPTGRIANASPIRAGGKKTNPGNEQFHGDLDSVFFRLLPRKS